MGSRMMYADPAYGRNSRAEDCRLVSPCKYLLDGLPKIYDDAALSDVTFEVGEQRLEIHAHRIVLSMVSTVMRNMFTSKTDARFHEKVCASASRRRGGSSRRLTSAACIHACGRR